MVSVWHPMTEAPRDGREILVLFHDNIAGSGWVYQIAYADKDGISVDDGRVSMTWDVCGYMRWQHLPAPWEAP